MRKKSNLVILAVILVAVSAYFLRQGANNITLNFTDSQLTVDGPGNFTYTIAYENIASLALETPTDFGLCIEGDTDHGVSYGLWESGQWGSYWRCTADSAEMVILVLDTTGNLLVFNYQDDENTSIVYDGFVDLLCKDSISAHVSPQ